MKNVIVAALSALFVGLSFAGHAAAAVALTTFTFTGTCGDCTGTVTAALTVSGYTPGQQLNTNNFVKFTYGGSNLMPGGYTINTVANGGYFSGSLSTAPGSYNVSIGGKNNADSAISYQFSSDNVGAWSTGLLLASPADQGTKGVWNAPAVAAAPEPGAWVLMLGGVGLAGLALRRRKDDVAATSRA